MNGAPRTLVLSDGGIVSLIACVSARESALAAVPASGPGEVPGKPLVVPRTLPAGSQQARQRAIALQCDALDLDLLAAPELARSAGTSDAELDTRDLVRAGYAAIGHECQLVLWPAHFQHDREIDLEAVSDAVDRALLVGRIITIDSAHGPVKIDAPYADLNDRQIAELVLDMDAPANLCWWWHAQLADPDVAGARDEFTREHRRWAAALAEVGWQAPP